MYSHIYFQQLKELCLFVLFSLCIVIKKLTWRQLYFFSQWFLRPTQDLTVLHRRQEVIRFFASPQNSDALSTLQSLLRNISNIPVRLGAVLHFFSHLFLLCCVPNCVCFCRRCYGGCLFLTPEWATGRVFTRSELQNCRTVYKRQTAYLQDLLFVCFCRPSTVQCVSGTKYETFLSPFSCSMISVKASQMTSAISPPSSIEL